MNVQIKTDNNIVASEKFAAKIAAEVASTLKRFADDITRVEVHLTDENGPDKSGGMDKRCVIEARLAGHQPVVASDTGPTIERAIDGAAAKVKRQIETIVDKTASGRVG